MQSLLSTVQNETVFATPSSGLARLETWADKVTPEMVNEAFRRRMPMKDPLFFVASTVDRKPADVVTAWEESGQIEVSPPEVKARARSPTRISARPERS